MDKYFKNQKPIAKKIRNLKLNKRLSPEELDTIHYHLERSLSSAGSFLKAAVMQALLAVDVNTTEDDVETMVELLIQRPDLRANKLFAFACAVKGKIEKK
jgi:DNA polymerase III delta prime subunit